MLPVSQNNILPPLPEPVVVKAPPTPLPVPVLPVLPEVRIQVQQKKVSCDYYAHKGQNTTAPHGATCTLPEQIAQERCSVHFNKPGARGWSKGNGPVSAELVEVVVPASPQHALSIPNSPVKSRIKVIRSPPRQVRAASPVRPPPKGGKVKVSVVEEEDLSLPEETVKDECPPGAIRCRLAPSKYKHAKGGEEEGDDLEPEEESDLTEQQIKHYSGLESDMRHNPDYAWLKEAMPEADLEELNAKERCELLARTVKNKHYDSLLWKGLRYGIPPIAEGVGGLIGMNLKNFGGGIDVFEKEFKSIMFMFRTEHAQFIEKYCTSTIQIGLQLGLVASIVHNANTAHEKAIMAAIEAKTVKVPQAEQQKPTELPLPVEPSGVKVEKPNVKKGGGMSLLEALSQPDPPKEYPK